MKGFPVGALTAAVMFAAFASAAPSALAATTTMVDLGQASTYAVLSGASVGNTVSAPGAPHTTLRGDLGVKANTQPTGFPPGVVTGTIRVGTAAASQAHADLVTAYAEVAARTGGAALAGALAGTTIQPGLHTVAGAVSNTTTVTLDGGGNPNAVFVFQVNGAMTMAAGSHVVLTNGARASRVFWQVNGAGAIGANADFAGTLMALDAVAVGNGSLVNGRAFARNGALTLDANEFYSAPPVVTIDGGSTAITTDTTPTISGTTDVEAPGIVAVTINGQTLNATPVDGAWSVTSAILANATYPVVASVSDGAGNPGTATQQLTVDTILPIITIDGGAAETTNDPTPTIAGTSDAAPGTVVRVTVDWQVLTALVQPTGTWNIRAGVLADGARTVTASVFDPAGNEGTDSQTLTIDTAAPAVTIAGGPEALTNDPTPELSGTAAVAPGTMVTVTLADETLTGPVDGGTWSTTASALSDGPHRVVMSVSDAAGNRATSTQVLTVDTVAPLVAINGAATATTNDGDPTIVGTSSAAPGTTVTVTISGQTMTTLVQDNGTWNATPSFVGEGTWPVEASAPDPAGNVGRASQSLVIAADAPAPAGGTDGTTSTTTPPAADGTAPTTTSSPADGTAPTTTSSPADGAAPVTTTPATDGTVSATTPPATSTAPVVTMPPPGTPAHGSTTAAGQATVARSSRQRIRGLALWIRTKVTASPRGRVRVTVSGTVKIKGVKKAIKLTRATATILAARSTTLKVKPAGTRKVAAAAFRKIRNATRSARVVTATITVRISDTAGNQRVVRRTVKLTR